MTTWRSSSSGRAWRPPRPPQARLPAGAPGLPEDIPSWGGGPAYAAMGEGAMEKHCEKRSWEEVLEAVWSRKREIEFLGGVLEDGEVLQDPNLPEEVRSFLEVVLES